MMCPLVQEIPPGDASGSFNGNIPQAQPVQ